jgi:hypothetical protein
MVSVYTEQYSLRKIPHFLTLRQQLKCLRFALHFPERNCQLTEVDYFGVVGTSNESHLASYAYS